MTLHLVTDLHRLSQGDIRSESARTCLLRQIVFAADARIDVVQIREPALDSRTLAHLVRDAVEQTRGTHTRIVVNDRVDVALAAGAGGVHLRSDSLSPVLVRRLTPTGFLIGQSVHTPEEAARARDVDYVIAGTVWPTESKPGAKRLLGAEGLERVVREAAVPVIAIGGVTVDGVARVAAAGAAGIAAIGLFMGANGDGCRAIPLAELTTACRMRFDTSGKRS